MPSCAFVRCTNHSKKKNKSNGITFHSFPGDEILKHKWLLVVRKQRQEPDWMPNQHSRICSIHFKEEDTYSTKKGYRRLTKTAVPFFRAAVMSSPNACSRSTTPNSLNSVSISDLESVFESPRITFLEGKLRLMQMKNMKIMQSNRNLKKRFNRLAQTCKNLKETVIQLRRKLMLQMTSLRSFASRQKKQLTYLKESLHIKEEVKIQD